VTIDKALYRIRVNSRGFHPLLPGNESYRTTRRING
jgi:hypothetical protein